MRPGATKPAFDRADLVARLGDESLVPEVCALFLDDAPGAAEELRAAVSRGDLSAARFAVHKLRGMLLLIGGAEAAAAAAVLEARVREGARGALGAALAALDYELSRLAPELIAAAELPPNAR